MKNSFKIKMLNIVVPQFLNSLNAYSLLNTAFNNNKLEILYFDV